MRAIHVANIPNARVYYILDGEEGGNDGAVVPPNQDPMFVNFWSFAERKRHLKPVTNTKFHKFFWDGHKGQEANRWNDMFFERLIKPDAEMLSSVSIITKFPNIKKERNNARGNHASEFKSLTAGGHHEKALGRRRRGGLGRGIGRVARGAASSAFDPKAWDGDGDGIVQERTPYERPAIPGINTNFPGMPHTPTKPADYPDDHRDPIGERPPAPQEKPDISRMTRFRPEGAVGEHSDLIPMPGRRAQRIARRENVLPPRTEGLRSATSSGKPYDTYISGINEQRVNLIATIKTWLSTMKGPDNFEAKRARDRKRVDKRLNGGNPIRTVAEAKKAMIKINPGFADGSSKADFLGKQSLDLVPGTGTVSVPQAQYKLGDMAWRPETEDLDEVQQQVMYSFLAAAMKSGRYNQVRFDILSTTTEVERGTAQISGHSHTDPKLMPSGYAAWAPGIDGTWRRVGDRWTVNTDSSLGRAARDPSSRHGTPGEPTVTVLYPDFETHPEMKDVGGPHMGPTANVAFQQFLKTMQLLEPEFDDYTPEERLAKETDAAIDPLDPDRTKRFNRIYHRAMLNFFTAVNEHEFGHVSHELAMFDDWKKKVAKDLPSGEMPWDALASFIEDGAIDLMDNQQKRRLVRGAALSSVHLSAKMYFGQVALSAIMIETMPASPARAQKIADLTKHLRAPILDAKGNSIKRTGSIAKVLREAATEMQGQSTVPYPASGDIADIRPGTPLTRGDLFMLLGSALAPTGGGPADKLPLLSMAMDDRNKASHPGRHEPWGFVMSMTDTGAGGIEGLSQEMYQRFIEFGTPEIRIKLPVGQEMKISSLPPEDVVTLFDALGRVSGQLPRAYTVDAPHLRDALPDMDPGGSIEHLPTASGMDPETLLRALLPGNHQQSLSADEIGELAKAEVGASLRIGLDDVKLADIGKARAAISSTSTTPISDEDAEKILRELAPEGEKVDWPIHLTTVSAGRRSLEHTVNPDTGVNFVPGDAIPRSVVDAMIKGLDQMAQQQLSLTVDNWGRYTQFFDELSRDEIKMLKMISGKFGGERYTPYMGRRYPAHSPGVYAVDATHQEIFSELATLYYAGERIRIEVPRDKGTGTKWRDLNDKEMAVVRKVVEWMYPNATRAGWTEDE